MKHLLESNLIKITRRTLETGAVLASLASLCSMILEWGFAISPLWETRLHVLDLWILGYFLFQLLGRLVIAPDKKAYLKVYKLEYLLGTLIGVILLWPTLAATPSALSTANATQATKIYLASTQLLVILFMSLGFARASRVLAKLRIQPARLVAGSFLVFIALGTALLLMPKAHNGTLSLVDACFLSTSAVCVTGLSPVDITTSLSFNGQIILLLLIQAGGLGIMTLAGGIGILFGGLGGMKQRMLLKDIMGSEGIEKVRDLLARIMLITLSIELLGALWLWFAWESQQPDPMLRLWWAVFHSISAFCNAGFSIIPSGLAQTQLAHSLGGLAGIALLVAAGSTGCLALHEVFSKALGKSRISLGSSVILKAHLGLMLLGALALWGTEKLSTQWGGYFETSWSTALFMSIMPRTAGFQNIDLQLLATPSLLIMLLLMIIGGAPGSTAGGIKVTSFVAVAAYLRSLVRGEEAIRMGQRELGQDTCLRAMALLLLYGVLLILASTLLLIYEDTDLLSAVFEVASALSTVGLSLNLTASLGTSSKILLMCCMFVGRLGFITVLWALFQKASTSPVRHPRENLPLF